VPHPTQPEILTTPELLALREMLANETLVIALRKVLAYDNRVQAESMENEALTAEPNTNRIIQYAARSRTSREFLETLKRRIEALTVRQGG
jgi:hypothetical protein